eukprot:6307164-Heterocapsa_arctica.AAC.1
MPWRAATTAGGIRVLAMPWRSATACPHSSHLELHHLTHHIALQCIARASCRRSELGAEHELVVAGAVGNCHVRWPPQDLAVVDPALV